MMTRNEIVAEIARGSMVEKIVQNVAHQALNANLQDLSQMIYLILLEYDEEKLQDLWYNNQMSFFLVRIVINQYRSNKSPFHHTLRKYQARSTDITGMDWIDDGN